MKIRMIIVAALLAALAATTPALAADRPYKDGPVLLTTYVRVLPGMYDTYMNHLAKMWVTQMETAKKEGVVLAYRVISSAERSPQDWNLVLAVEVKNMAALDTFDDQMEEIGARGGSTPAQRDEAFRKRSEMRTILGYKLNRVVEFK